MRVLQLIDSLDAGGAERMAVNLANALVTKIDRSYLCATRHEGLLKSSIHKDVLFLFLKKKGAIDLIAFQRFHSFLKTERIDIIHAHSSSYFLAVLVSRLSPSIKVVWHDHYGNSNYLNKRPKRILKVCSNFFAHSFGVNTNLVIWARTVLRHNSVSFLPNFIDTDISRDNQVFLEGRKGTRIVCIANLRPQKDHVNLIRAFSKLIKKFPKYTLHFVGQDFGDSCSEEIYKLVSELELSDSVFFYGSCAGISAILTDCDIGVLSSKSEGLPLALLEYGRASLPVIVTDVGDCARVVENEISGLVIAPEDTEALFTGLLRLIVNSEKAQRFGLNLKKTITDQYSTNAVIDLVMKHYIAL